MIISSHQITFLPYIGFWRKMAQSDIMDLTPVYDQLNKGDYTHRVKIGDDTNNRWLTLPIGSKNLHRPSIEIKLKNELLPNLYSQLEGWYRNSPNWSLYKDYLYTVFCECRYEYFWELNFKLLLWVRDLLGISTILSIDTDTNKLDHTTSTSKLITRVKRLNGTVYLSGVAGKNYLNEDEFVSESIELSYVDNERVEDYSTVSILSLVMNKSIDEVKDLVYRR